MSSSLRATLKREAGMDEYRGNRDYSTAHSSVRNGQVYMDPSIRNIQDQTLQRSNALYGDIGNASSEYTKNLRGIGKEFEGNNAGYIQARVNPILQQSALRKGEMQRGHGMRNMGGSSFANQDMNNLSSETARAESDARALGTRENLDTRRGIEGDIYGGIRDRIGTQAGLNQENNEVAKARLQEELAALGLSKDQIEQEMKMFEAEQERRNSTNKSIGESVSGMFSFGGGGGGSG